MYSSAYHQILDDLYLGNANSLETRRFDMIVNCTKEYEIPFPTKYQPICIRISINDDPSESSKLLSFMKDTNVLEQIHNQLQTKNTVLVHCSRGQQRSCAVVSCYLIRYHKMTAVEAIDFIKSKRPIAFFGSEFNRCNYLN